MNERREFPGRCVVSLSPRETEPPNGPLPGERSVERLEKGDPVGKLGSRVWCRGLRMGLLMAVFACSLLLTAGCNSGGGLLCGWDPCCEPCVPPPPKKPGCRDACLKPCHKYPLGPECGCP
jgi:hypothetical protein